MKIAGADLLEMALERVLEIEHLIGGKTVYIEWTVLTSTPRSWLLS